MQTNTILSGCRKKQKTASLEYPETFCRDEKMDNHNRYVGKHTLDELSNEPIQKNESAKDSAVIRFVNNLLVLGVCILLAYLLASFVTHYIAHETKVEGESMEPSLTDGDSIIIQKVSYYLGEPERFDVVVFPVQQENTDSKTKNYYVKRVIGLPNETVQILDGKVYIDGEELKGDTYCLSDILDAGNAANPITLGNDEYFVLGDNRNRSTDSRSDYVGTIHRKDIVGEVLMCIWPLSHIGLIPQ